MMNLSDLTKTAMRMVHLRNFKRQVTDRGNQIDRHSEQDWYSITLGWAIANNMNPEEAHDFARFVRYHTDLA
jgi:hypothetical protein